MMAVIPKHDWIDDWIGRKPRLSPHPRIIPMNSIHWPEGYLPGFTDNFVSNEVIVAGLSAAQVWPISPPPPHGRPITPTAPIPPFSTAPARCSPTERASSSAPSAFPSTRAATTMSLPPMVNRAASPGTAGPVRKARRTGWTCITPGWSRIWTGPRAHPDPGNAEGEPAKELAKADPNPMINGHQDWLNGLVRAA
jgi:hypothetical protein